jgi:hypothetical protein
VNIQPWCWISFFSGGFAARCCASLAFAVEVQQMGTVDNSSCAFALVSKRKATGADRKSRQWGEKAPMLPQNPSLLGDFLAG